jgi:Rrf2 family protein
MKLSLRGTYALRALIVLGQQHSDRSVVTIQAISDQQNIPKRFLEQIMHDLKAGGMVESKRGTSGGYRLHRPPESITLAEIVRYIEGPLAPVNCVSQRAYEPCTCPEEAACAIRSVMKEVRDAIAQILEGLTLAQLCERARQLQAKPSLDFMI